jgi:hypothetical protein
MAFATTLIGKDSGLPSIAYNIDFPVGAGARGNLPEDIALVQAVLRIVHFEVRDPLRPPAGEKDIAVDGILGPQTMRFIIHAQRLMKEENFPVRLDGVLDPYRGHKELSTAAKVRYVFELLNNGAFNRCRRDGMDNYEALAHRDDIPPVLAVALRGPQRIVARKYENELVH